MQVRIDTDGEETSIRIAEGEADLPEPRTGEGATASPPPDQFDKSTARDAGGPPKTMLGPDGLDPSPSRSGGTWPPEREGTTVHSGGAFQEPNST